LAKKATKAKKGRSRKRKAKKKPAKRKTAKRPKAKARAVPIENTAYHEAGHAVVACRLRRPFRYVTIEPESDSLGHVRKYSWARTLEKTKEEGASPAMQRRLEHDILMMYAGPHAEAKHTGRQNRRGASHDNANAVSMGGLLHDYSSVVLERYLDYLWARAEELVRGPFLWRLIGAVADDLLQRRRLSKKQVRETIARASSRRPPG